MDNIQRRVIEPTAETYMPEAERKLRSMMALREFNGTPLLRAVWPFSGFFYYLETCDAYNRITAWAEADLPHIYFSSELSEGFSSSFQYNYLTDKLWGAPKTTFAGDVHYFANGIVQKAEEGQAKFKDRRWTNTPYIEKNPTTPLGTLQRRELELHTDGTNLHVRTEEGIKNTGLVRGTFLTELSAQQADATSQSGSDGYGLAAYNDSTTYWNLWSAISNLFYRPTVPVASESWVWIPSIFVQPPEFSPDGIVFGFYYGDGANRWYPVTNEFGFPVDLKNAHIKLLATVETKDSSVKKKVGWAEHLVSYEKFVNAGVHTSNITTDRIFLYFGETYPTLNYLGYYIYRTVVGAITNETVSTGTIMPGYGLWFEAEISTLRNAQEPDEIKLWNLMVHVDGAIEGETDFSALGIIIVEGNPRQLLRLKKLHHADNALMRYIHFGCAVRQLFLILGRWVAGDTKFLHGREEVLWCRVSEQDINGGHTSSQSFLS